MQKERKKKKKRKKSLTVDTLRGGGGGGRRTVERGINTQPYTHTLESTHTDTERQRDKQTDGHAARLR